jgi:hypothetical protein
MMEMSMPVNDILGAAKEAGRQLARDGEMSPKTLATVSRQLMALEMYIQEYNKWGQEALDTLEKN